MTQRARQPWDGCFVDPDRPDQPATVRLRQVTRTSFVLESSLRYTGPAGVPGLPDEARTLRPADLGDPPLTDLATVPSALRWFLGPYGVHTPAALLHDRLVGPRNTLRVTHVQADRFFRFMLTALGVRLLRRWLMWAAVSFGTRWRDPGARPWVALWAGLAVLGTAAFGWGAVTGTGWLVITAAALPLPASALWGRQYGAGLLAAVTALWVLPPTLLGAVGFGVYRLLELGISLLPLDRDVRGDEPVDYRHF